MIDQRHYVYHGWAAHVILYTWSIFGPHLKNPILRMKNFMDFVKTGLDCTLYFIYYSTQVNLPAILEVINNKSLKLDMCLATV
jgi:hypothetical protein